MAASARGAAVEDRVRHDWDGLEGWRATLVARLGPHCRDANEVEDLVQETLLRAARHRRAVRDPERFRAWLLRIAFNALRDLRRRARLAGAVPLEEAVDVPAEPARETPADVRIGGWLVPWDEALEHLRSVRDELREDDLRLLDAYYAADDPHASVRAAGVPSRLVKVRLFRARGRLRSALRRRVERRASARAVLRCS